MARLTRAEQLAQQAFGNFKAPSAKKLHRLMAPMRAWFSPQFYGLDSLDLKRPALFVGNHALFSIDAGLMLDHLYTHYGVLPRSLGDHLHFRIPGWGQAVTDYGGVEGTPENCSELMRRGESILVFPGGAREVNRRKSDRYEVIWKQRTGFARLAIQHGYDIIPFASVGANESYEIVLDADDVRSSTLWQWLDRGGRLNKLVRDGDLLSPVVKGIGPTLLPRPQPFYFAFGERISTAPWQTEAVDPSSLWAVRDQTERAIHSLMAQLQVQRQIDQPKWPAWRRWLAPLQD